MKEFNYNKVSEGILTSELVKYLSFIYQEKGRQQLFIEQRPAVLSRLLEVSVIQSTESSNRIEGIRTSDKRLRELVTEKSEPRNRSEKEISGYREVLTLIHQNYDEIPVSSNMILQLHKELYSYTSSGIGGIFKHSDNFITEILDDGTEHIRFKPVPAFQTQEFMEELCNAFNKAMREDMSDPLILIPMFILDFLCIHPFNDGNGRMSRLLTLLLLYKSGYIVGKYLSIEMLIEKTKDTYYETLFESSQEWHEGKNDYVPFVLYFLGVIKKSYIEFADRVEHIKTKTLSKPDRVKIIIDNHIGKISKNKIMELAPDISKITIERTLADLLKEGYIEKIGQGKNTAYVKNI